MAQAYRGPVQAAYMCVCGCVRFETDGPRVVKVAVHVWKRYD